MKAPLSFAWRNLVFGRDHADAWALYRLHTRGYPGLSSGGKLEALGQLAAFAVSIEADFQLLRVSRRWSAEDYRRAALAMLDDRWGFPERLNGLIDSHDEAVGADTLSRPEVFLAVSLGTAGQSAWRRVLADFGLTQAAALTQRRLGALLDAEAAIFGRVTDYLDAERATSLELQWLVRRSLHRASREPWLDEHWAPQALVLDADDEEGGRRYRPLEAEMLRLFDEPIAVCRDHLRIGESFQTTVVLGALPETVTFPGRHAELLFAPLEAVDFPVDACFSARFIANDRALALVRRKIVDADHAFGEELHGDHGPTAQTSVRPDLARELEEQLAASDRPPLLRSQVSYIVSGGSEEELEERVRRFRRELAPIALHRPKDVQFDLWTSHLPAQRPSVRRYDDILLPEQFGAMVPTATHAVGGRTGLMIGRTMSGSRQPVLFDITQGSRESRAPAVLCTGTLGSGKTLTAQLLALHALLSGSKVVDLDPKGDHCMVDVLRPELVEQVELRADGTDRGMLDPLRIAPPDLRVELAHSFLCELLPAPISPEWQTEIRAAVAEVAGAGGRSCAQVLDVLRQGPDDARAAAKAIAVHAESGLLQLGFADGGPGDELDPERPLTSLRIANLTLPESGTPRSELTQEERTGRALLRLLTVQALHVASSDWSRHKVLIVEELSQVIGDQLGLALVQRIVRLCRSQNATPILVTQVVDDVAKLADLIGCFFCFGVESDAEAGRVLRLLGLDADDEDLRGQLRSFRRGRCLMKDYDGRVSPVQVDLMDPQLLAALDTTPLRAAHGASGT